MSLPPRSHNVYLCLCCLACLRRRSAIIVPRLCLYLITAPVREYLHELRKAFEGEYPPNRGGGGGEILADRAPITEPLSRLGDLGDLSAELFSCLALRAFSDDSIRSPEKFIASRTLESVAPGLNPG
jgi:hypothetical protein